MTAPAQRSLPLLLAECHLRDGSIHRQSVAVAYGIEELAVVGKNHCAYIIELRKVGRDGTTVRYEETKRRRDNG